MNTIIKKLIFFIAILSLSSFGTKAIFLKYILANENNYLHNISSNESYSEGKEPQHFSQADYPKNKGERQDFNEETTTRHIDQLIPYIKLFSGTSNVNNLEQLLHEIARLSDIAYNADKRGTVRGTHKHTLCKEFMQYIKSHYKGFSDIYPEYSTGNSRFDVVWFTGDNAYVFDYKFGDEKNTSKSSNTQQYKNDLSSIGYKMVGNIRDVHP